MPPGQLRRSLCCSYVTPLSTSELGSLMLGWTVGSSQVALKRLWVGGASEMCVNNLHVLGRGWELGLYFALLASLVWLEERIWGRMCYGLSCVPPKFTCCLLIPTTSECHCTWRQGLLGSS